MLLIMSRYDLIWLLNILAVIVGFVLFMISLTEVEHIYFAVGLLLFTVGVYRYGYLRGYGIGQLAQFEADRKKEG